MNGQDNKQVIEEYLARHNTMAVATCNGDRPWAAAVFYVSDADLSLYFKSDPKTLHMQDIATFPAVAATVHEDNQAWTSIRGVQIYGSCHRVGSDDFTRVDNLYLQKYPFLSEVTEHSENADQRILAGRLHNTPYYQLRPSWIRLIDNTVSFGYKTEIQLDAGLWNS